MVLMGSSILSLHTQHFTTDSIFLQISPDNEERKKRKKRKKEEKEKK